MCYLVNLEEPVREKEIEICPLNVICNDNIFALYRLNKNCKFNKVLFKANDEWIYIKLESAVLGTIV